MIEKAVVEDHGRLCAERLRPRHQRFGVGIILLVDGSLPSAGNQRLFPEEPLWLALQQRVGDRMTLCLVGEHEDRIRRPCRQRVQRVEDLTAKLFGQGMGFGGRPGEIAQRHIVAPGQIGHVVGGGDLTRPNDGDFE